MSAVALLQAEHVLLMYLLQHADASTACPAPLRAISPHKFVGVAQQYLYRATP